MQVGTVKEEEGGADDDEEDDIEEYIEGNSIGSGRMDDKHIEGDEDDGDRAGDGNEVSRSSQGL